jgi:hypothetical protein
MRTVRGVLMVGVQSHATIRHGRNVIVDAQIATRRVVGDVSAKAGTWCAAGQPPDVEGVAPGAPDLDARVAAAATGARAGRTDSVDAAPDGPLSVLPTTRRLQRCRPRAVGYVSVLDQSVGNGLEGARARAGWYLAAWAQREGLTLVGVFADVRGEGERGFYALVAAVQERGAVAVVVPGLDHVRHLGCLTGADVRCMSRYLRAALLVARPESSASGLDLPAIRDESLRHDGRGLRSWARTPWERHVGVTAWAAGELR